MSEHISEEAVAVVARAIHDAAYETETEERRQQLWVGQDYPRGKRKREARAAITAYEDWRAKNGDGSQ